MSCGLSCFVLNEYVTLSFNLLEIHKKPRLEPLNRAGFKCVEALGRIIIRGPYPPSNADESLYDAAVL